MWGTKEKSGEFSDNNVAQNEARIEYGDVIECPPHTTERKLVTRIDFRVIPFLCILYLLAFLDRINISNANVFGLSTELKLDGLKYNTALVIFFVPYILFEIPSNIILKKLKPHVWLSLCMFLFGLVTVCQGLVSSYGGLLTTRFLLGVFEAGMFPGCFYLISMWYRREEAQKRYTFFFNSTSLAGAFGGLLASAIGKMDGLRGHRGWRWIFILEGVLTCVVSLLFYFALPDFPEEAKWLTPEEREYVKARLRRNQGKSGRDHRITISDAFRTLRNPKVLIGAINYMGLIVPAYGYAYFSPAIIQTYGYSRIQTQLHSVPPWAASFVWAMLLAILSDRFRHRIGFALFSICLAITGFTILLTVHNHLRVQYAALFLITMGAYGAMPIIVCWYTLNLRGHLQRAIGTGWQVGFGNIGGIIAVYIFLSKDAPKYTLGHSVCIAFACLSFVSCCVYSVVCMWENKTSESDPESSDDEGPIRNLL